MFSGNIKDVKEELLVQLYKIQLYEKMLQTRKLEIELGLPQSKFTYGISSNKIKKLLRNNLLGPLTSS